MNEATQVIQFLLDACLRKDITIGQLQEQVQNLQPKDPNSDKPKKA